MSRITYYLPLDHVPLVAYHASRFTLHTSRLTSHASRIAYHVSGAGKTARLSILVTREISISPHAKCELRLLLLNRTHTSSLPSPLLDAAEPATNRQHGGGGGHGKRHGRERRLNARVARTNAAAAEAAAAGGGAGGGGSKFKIARLFVLGATPAAAASPATDSPAAAATDSPAAAAAAAAAAASVVAAPDPSAVRSCRRLHSDDSQKLGYQPLIESTSLAPYVTFVLNSPGPCVETPRRSTTRPGPLPTTGHSRLRPLATPLLSLTSP